MKFVMDIRRLLCKVWEGQGDSTAALENSGRGKGWAEELRGVVMYLHGRVFA